MGARVQERLDEGALRAALARQGRSGAEAEGVVARARLYAAGRHLEALETLPGWEEALLHGVGTLAPRGALQS